MTLSESEIVDMLVLAYCDGFKSARAILDAMTPNEAVQRIRWERELKRQIAHIHESCQQENAKK